MLSDTSSSSSHSSRSLRSQTKYSFRALTPPLHDDDDVAVPLTPPLQDDLLPDAATMTTLEIAGIVYTKNATKKVVSETVVEQVLLKKQDRAKLPTEDRTSLFEKATKQGHKKFDLLPLALNDEEKLDDTYSLEVLIRKMKRQHCTFDMHNVFTIISPNSATEAVGFTLDLYTKVAKISIEDVA